MVKVILRTRYTCDECDDLILCFRHEENEQEVVENIKNFIEELKCDTNGAYTTDDILERISEVYDIEIINPKKLKVVEYWEV